MEAFINLFLGQFWEIWLHKSGHVQTKEGNVDSSVFAVCLLLGLDNVLAEFVVDRIFGFTSSLNL